MKKAFSGVLLAIVMVFSLIHAAAAGPVMDRILKKGELLVGTTGEQPPLNATSKNGEIIGMDADIARIIAKSLGVRLKFKSMPFNDLLPAVEAGKIDMVISSMTITPQRNRKLAFVGPYYMSGKGILTKTKTLAKLQKPEAMNNSSITVAVLKDSTSQTFAEQTASKAKIVKTKSYDAAIGMLLVDKVDAIIADFPFCAFTAYRYRDKGIVAGESPISFEPLGIVVVEDALMINWLENFINMLKGTGLLNKIHARWFKDGSWIGNVR
jgi:polar amino acid transport system substrate-binding protein